jgi:hypothetical protein
VSSTYSGSHRRFWDFFYRAVATLRPLVDPLVAFALAPISSDPVWQIDRRNEINYDAYRAIMLAVDFQSSFSKASFPASLPGILGTQYNVLEGLLEIVFEYRRKFGLQTDALSSFDTSAFLGKCIRNKVYGPRTPALVSKTKKALLVRT